MASSGADGANFRHFRLCISQLLGVWLLRRVFPRKQELRIRFGRIAPKLGCTSFPLVDEILSGECRVSVGSGLFIGMRENQFRAGSVAFAEYVRSGSDLAFAKVVENCLPLVRGDGDEVVWWTAVACRGCVAIGVRGSGKKGVGGQG